MKNIIKIIIIFLCFVLNTQIANAQAGILDKSFGNDGLIVANSFNFGSHSILQPDGKILLIGETNGVGLDQFNPDGSYDESFGINGHMEISLNGKLFGPLSKTFALLEDGKIICAARYFPNGGQRDIGIIRCFSDGRLDSSFGYNGYDSLAIDNINTATGLVVQPDGKIVISGDVQKNEYNEQRTFICRFLPDGGLDPTFGEGGIVISNYINATNSNSLIIKKDGKLVRGSTHDKYDDHPEFMLESFNPDGSKDVSFGENGTAIFIFGNGQTGNWNTRMEKIALQYDDKIVCTGESGKDKNIYMALCRFNEDGSMDNEFGENGGIVVPYKENVDVFSLDIDFQPDGKILTAGGSGAPFKSLVLVRYNSNGQLDPSFGEDGISDVVSDTAILGAGSVHYLDDGKILTSGQLTPIGPTAYILLARFNGDNVLATNFKDVKAAQNNDAITITWQTLNEDGTKSFTIERSGNANDFVGINTVPAKGVASIYNYTDKNPLDGISYYRIRENAANATNTFSPVVKVVFNSTGVISLYPNPAKNTVTVKGLNKNVTAIIKITDMQGREISSQNFTQSSSATLNIRALAQGTYFVQVSQEGKVVRLKLIKE